MPNKVIEGSGTDMMSVLEDNHYPSDSDMMLSDDTPYEGTSSSLPSENPLISSATKLPISSSK